MRSRLPALNGCLVFCLLTAVPARPADPPDYDKDVKPLLEKHCFQCHGPEKQRGGLRLDVKKIVFQGGDSGEPAVVPGSPLKSHLLKLVTASDPKEAMPPKGERLKPEEVATLSKWIETGAHWLDSSQPKEEIVILPVEPGLQITPEHRRFWSFVPPRAFEPPAVANGAWPRTTIDRFILSRLETAGLAPAADAPRQILIRRVTFDLTGLPPTPAEVDSFLADTRPDAYERLVDRLLASPRFGERFASMWLPLARYAEDQAHQVGTDTKFFYPNAFKYRQWVVDAFNKDVPYDQFLRLQLAADRILAVSAAPESALLAGHSAVAEDLAALGFLGLGPKYYNRNRLEVMADEWEDRVDTVTRTMLGLTVACARCHDHKFDPIPTTDYYALAGIFASTKMVNKTPAGEIQKNDLQADKMATETLHLVEDNAEAQNLNLFIRGNVDRKGPAVPRRFLSILCESEPAPFTQGSGRLELANAIASSGNPLTARVMVNRVWGLLYGSPLVPTPSNFGYSGQPPTHPELLDDLSVRFMNGGWSIKSLVREIVTSSTYRQDSRVPSNDADPANQLLGRMNRRRMTIEQWRDSILFASSQLDPIGGKSLELTDPKNLKRTLYARISRLQLNDLLMHFDYPDANVHSERRSVTSTPGQKLFMINSPFMIEQAKSLAERIQREAPDYDQARIRYAYRLLYARDPGDSELGLALEFLRQPNDAELSRCQQYAQILLVSNEAIYVD